MNWISGPLYRNGSTLIRAGKRMKDFVTHMNKIVSKAKSLYQKKLAKISHNIPVFIFQMFIENMLKKELESNLETFSQMIGNMSYLSFDIMIFMILKYLKDCREK